MSSPSSHTAESFFIWHWQKAKEKMLTNSVWAIPAYLFALDPREKKRLRNLKHCHRLSETLGLAHILVKVWLLILVKSLAPCDGDRSWSVSDPSCGVLGPATLLPPLPSLYISHCNTFNLFYWCNFEQILPFDCTSSEKRFRCCPLEKSNEGNNLVSWFYISIYPSATLLEPLTVKVINTDHLSTMQRSHRNLWSYHSCYLTRKTHLNNVSSNANLLLMTALDSFGLMFWQKCNNGEFSTL